MLYQDLCRCLDGFFSVERFVFLGELPLDEIIADQVDSARDDPSNRVGEEEHFPRTVYNENGIEPYDTKTADTADGNAHRNERATKTAKLSDRNVHDTAKEIERAENEESAIAVADRFGISGNINGEQRLAEKDADRAKRNTDDGNACDTKSEDLSHALILSCGVVLTCKVERGLIKRTHRHQNEGFDAGGSRAAVGKGSCASRERNVKGVDGGLNENIGNAEYTALNTCGKTDLDHIGKASACDAELAEAESAHTLLSAQAEHDEERGDRLRNDRTDGNAGNVHMEEIYENEIEDDVCKTCDCKEIERSLGISRRSQDRSAEVIDHIKGRADEIYGKIENGLVDDGIRRIHPLQKGS